MRPRGYAAISLSLASCAIVAGCGSSGGGSSSKALTVYTCVSDTTIQPVIDEFEAANPGTEVKLYRAPTGELNARVAGDVRSGGLRADVVWACDPLTMQGYVNQGLVGGWTPENASAVPPRFRTDDYVGVAVLYMLVVHGKDVPAPTTWKDLSTPTYADGVALPDPAYAASALGMLGYFAQSPDYGMDYLAGLEQNGAVQVSTPDDVTAGVAEGVYRAGITIANSAYLAQESGSPIGVVWPEPGAIAIYGPVALAKESADSQTAKDFLTYVVSEEGQTTIANSGSYPTLPSVSGPTFPDDAAVVAPDWSALADDTDRLLREYQTIFGG